MTAPGSPRPSFRIDPRAAERASPPPAPRPTTPAAAPPPPPPSPALPPPEPAPRRRKWLIPTLAIVAIVVVAGLGYAGYKLVQSETYPHKYLLSSAQAPRGMTLSDPSGMDELDGQVEPGKNPSRFTREGLDNMASEVGVRPEEAWGESLDTPSGEKVLVIAMKFPSRERADGAVSRLRLACSFGSPTSTLLQDEDVVVLVAAQGTEASSYETRVVNALKAKASGLRVVC